MTANPTKRAVVSSRCTALALCPAAARRHGSTHSAIHRGIRASSQFDPDTAGRPGRRTQWQRGRPDPARPPPPARFPPTGANQLARSHPSSEFLYGVAAVTAALLARRRVLHRLYLYPSRLGRPDGRRRGQEQQQKQDNDRSDYGRLRELAAAAGVRAETVPREMLAALDHASGRRPHNGVVLECSPLSVPDVVSLGRLPSGDNGSSDHVPLQLGPMSVSEQADLARLGVVSLPRSGAGGVGVIAASTPRRFPLVLLLDSITDPANVGSVLRSAYYLGVSAVVVGARGTAAVSSGGGDLSAAAVVAKTAAGAADAVPVFKTASPGRFLTESSNVGWTTLVAGAPVGADGGARVVKKEVAGGPRVAAVFQRAGLRPGRPDGRDDDGPLLDVAPTVLLIGGEGLPVQPHLARLADGVLSIWPGSGRGVRAGPEKNPADGEAETEAERETRLWTTTESQLSSGREQDNRPDVRRRHDPEIVDSLNVGVAAAVACQWLLSGGRAE